MKRTETVRKLALFIVTVMVFVSVGTWIKIDKVYAADWTYTTNSTGITLTKYNGSASSVTIPGTIDGKKVTQIGNESFNIFYRNESSVKTVTLPAQSIILNKNAFNGCSNLTTVNNSNYATQIGTGCFAGCKSLTSFTFSNSVTALGDSAFRNTGLKEVTLPSSVKSMRQYVFGNCSSLKKVTILNPSLDFKDNTIFSGTSGVTIYAASGSTSQSKASELRCSFAVYSGSGSSGGSSSGGSSSGGSSGSGSSASGGSSNCEHNWKFKSLKQTATCVAERAENQECSKCGATRVYTYSGTKIAHKMGDYLVVVSPSATRDGYKVATCSMCGKEDKVVLPAYNSSGSGSSGDSSGGSSSGGSTSGGSSGGSGNSSSGNGGSGSSDSSGSTGSGDSGNTSGGTSSGGSSGSGSGGSSGSTSGGSSSGSGNSGSGSGSSGSSGGSNAGNSGDSSNNGEADNSQQSTGSQLSGVENFTDTTVTETEPVKQIPLPLIIGVVVVVIGIGYLVIRKRQ